MTLSKKMGSRKITGSSVLVRHIHRRLEAQRKEGQGSPTKAHGTQLDLPQMFLTGSKSKRHVRFTSQMNSSKL